MSTNEIPFLHEASLRVLRIEREALVIALKTIKRRINHLQYLRVHEPDDFYYFGWVSKYSGDVSKLTKRRNSLRSFLKDVEASIQLLKDDGQKSHERAFQSMKRKTEGSYNCAYGC
jgi:hypothetical protein